MIVLTQPSKLWKAGAEVADAADPVRVRWEDPKVEAVAVSLPPQGAGFQKPQKPAGPEQKKLAGIRFNLEARLAVG
ncbi:MAG TPA: hypothetical protein VG759_22045 [Candidatus Angelobacter sp.]|nr:hypothetical protein [Candidatus Angelobacter sp.]